LTSLPFHPNFVMFPLDHIADVGVSQSSKLKLLGREAILTVRDGPDAVR